MRGLIHIISLLLASSLSVSDMCGLEAQHPLEMTSQHRTDTFVPSSYSVVPGIFIQDDPTANLGDYDLLNDSFGLVDKSPERWTNLTSFIEQLNMYSDSLTAYKLVYAARHGQGFHNVGESKYGSVAWDCHWSMLTGDGEITWGPDPYLTPLGESQARAVNIAWKRQLEEGVPLPQVLYSSPLRRAADTLNLTWHDMLIKTPPGSSAAHILPIFKEQWRETIGLHTCDQRSDKSTTAAEHPGWLFEDTYSEHDELWNPTYQESSGQQALRIQQALNELFARDSSMFVSITAHSGVINALFRVVGHRKIAVPPGAFVPMLIKAVGHPNATQPVVVGGPSATAPACSTATIP